MSAAIIGTRVSVPTGGVQHLLDQAYNAGGPLQWAAEAATNALLAGADWIEFGFQRDILEKRGVRKRLISDNGVGMDADALQLFMTSFGGGGRPIGIDLNFGQGFKSSCFKWNPYGIIVASWTEGDPEGAMIWIARDPKSGDYGLRQFDIGEDETSEVVVPGWESELGVDLSKLRTPEIEKAGHGTVFLLLGKSIDDDTEYDLGRAGEKFTVRGVAQFLNRRFLTLPKNVNMGSVGLEAEPLPGRRTTRDDTVTLPSGKVHSWHRRTVTGMSAFMPELESNGSVTVDSHGTVVRWALAKEPGVSGDSAYGPAGACIVVQHRTVFGSVVYDTAYDMHTTMRDYRNFGVSEESVARRLWLIVEPPVYTGGSEWGVFPQASRSMLMAKGGLPLPWDAWGDAFFAHLPAEIRAAIDAARAGESTGKPELSERIKKMLARLNRRFRPVHVVEHSDGEIPGEPTGAHTGKARTGGKRPTPPIPPTPPVVVVDPRPSDDNGMAGDKSILTPVDHGTHKGVEKHKGDGTPAVHWDSSPGITFGASFDEKDIRAGSSGTITLNPEFTMFVTEFDYWTAEYDKVDPGDVIALVKEVYEEEIVSRVKHIMSLSGKTIGIVDGVKISMTPGVTKPMLQEPALTASLLGLTNVEQRIRVIAGARFGRASSAA